jgi:DNA-nicking Smr family endonuclease
VDEDEPIAVPIEDAIDLHAFSPRDIIAVVDDYLEAAHAAGFAVVRLIHGRGKGVQRASIHRHLRAHALVAEFWDAAESHLGATIVRLRTRG